MRFDADRALAEIAALNRVGEHPELRSLAKKLEVSGAHGKIDYNSDDLAIPATRYERLNIPKCGIYFLFYGGELVYVGQSTNISARLSSHIGEERISFDSYACIGCPPSRLNDLEALYTLKFKPTRNVHEDGRPKHTGVVGTLKRIKLDGRVASSGIPARREYRGRMVNVSSNA